jgi:hypothetical protein
MTTLQEIIKEMEEDLKKQELLKNEATNNNDLNYHQGRIRSLQNHLPKLKSLLSEQGNERKDEEINFSEIIKNIPLKTRIKVATEMAFIELITELGYRENKAWTESESDTHVKLCNEAKKHTEHTLEIFYEWEKDGRPSQPTTQRDEEKKNEPTEEGCNYHGVFSYVDNPSGETRCSECHKPII